MRVSFAKDWQRFDNPATAQFVAKRSRSKPGTGVSEASNAPRDPPAGQEP
jgi:hypothetical protein